MRGEGTEQLDEQCERVEERLAVGPAQLSLAREDALLEVLDAVEQAHDVTYGAVHLEALELLGDLLHRGPAPFLQPQTEMLRGVSDLGLGVVRRAVVARAR